MILSSHAIAIILTFSVLFAIALILTFSSLLVSKLSREFLAEILWFALHASTDLSVSIQVHRVDLRFVVFHFVLPCALKHRSTHVLASIILALVILLVSQLEHLLEDVLFIELKLASLASRHVSQVTDESHDISRVALHVWVTILRDGVVTPLRVGARNVQEPILIDRIGQDVIVMHRSEAVLVGVGLRKDQMHEVGTADT